MMRSHRRAQRKGAFYQADGARGWLSKELSNKQGHICKEKKRALGFA